MRRLNDYGPSLIVLSTAILVLCFGPWAMKRLEFGQTERRMIRASHQLETNNILAEFNDALTDIANLVEPSVVHINAQQVVGERQITSVSSGSGWIYDAAGHIVTNYHVVRDATRIDVQLESGELREAQLLGYDRSTDIAVIRAAGGLLHPAIRSDLQRPVEQGQLIFAFGSPFDFRFSMSSGIVSGKGRHVDVLGRSGYENFIQVDAAINPGNSGGPLTDYRGHVIGMNTAIATGRRSSLDEGQFAGIGLAIPLEMIEPVVSQIINNNGVVEKGLLGVVPSALNPREAQRRGFVGNGVIVTSVQPGFPADTAGVQVEDIITAVNGQSISSPAQLRSIVSSLLPGAVASLDIWRPDADTPPGIRISIDVTLARLDPLRDSGVLPDDQNPIAIPQLGLTEIATNSEALAAELGVDYHRGVMVRSVAPGSSTARRIGPGTTIVDVLGQPVYDTNQLYTALRQFNLIRGVRIGVIHSDGRSESVLIQVQR